MKLLTELRRQKAIILAEIQVALMRKNTKATPQIIMQSNLSLWSPRRNEHWYCIKPGTHIS
jgi:hypothetical protein